MARFNLLDEPWINVVIDAKGQTKEVSLKDVFKNAHIYKGLAGDMETQDFALMRVLLAVLHTVFSRFNAQGEEYDYFELDDCFRQIENIEEDDIDDYLGDLYGTWFDLWEEGKFPNIVVEYLEKWRERFYLFDDKYPFFQVVAEDISADKISKPQASSISGKNINRLISESGNKLALFSPKYESKQNKNILSAAQIARWLVTFQGYTGLSDKVIFGTEKYKNSKGWLFDIGGIYFKLDNLFETLMLNFMIVQRENDNVSHIQKPCWEYESGKVIESYFESDNMDNMASLYTAWSRAIYINPDIDLSLPFECSIVKLPEISHQDKFIEPMTVWKYNKDGENKEKYTPRKHQANKAMWRSFGMITINEDYQRKVGIVDWVNDLKSISKKYHRSFESQNPVLCAVSMKDDGNATSWVPADEIVDYLSIDEYVLADLQENGWVIRINEVVEQTKKLISVVFKNYLLDIKKIRNTSSNAFGNQKVEELYFKIDQPFRRWISSICVDDEKDGKVIEWRNYLKKFLILEAEDLLSSASSRDFIGVEVDGKIKNIATVYNRFIISLNKEL